MYCKDCKHAMKTPEGFPHAEEHYNFWKCAAISKQNYISGEKDYALCVLVRLSICKGERFEAKK